MRVFASTAAGEQDDFARGRSGRETREVLSFDPQAVANIVNAFARLEIRDDVLFALMHRVILNIAPSRWDTQVCINRCIDMCVCVCV